MVVYAVCELFYSTYPPNSCLTIWYACKIYVGLRYHIRHLQKRTAATLTSSFVSALDVVRCNFWWIGCNFRKHSTTAMMKLWVVAMGIYHYFPTPDRKLGSSIYETLRVCFANNWAMVRFPSANNVNLKPMDEHSIPNHWISTKKVETYVCTGAIVLFCLNSQSN